MHTDTCFCGEGFSGESMDALLPVVKAHFDEAHANFGVTEQGALNWLESRDRVNGPTERLERIGTVEVRDVTPDLVGDWVSFFDHDAFADNRGWASCYCLFHHVGGSQQEWQQRSWRDNRSGMSERLRTGASWGLLAYVGGRPAAWCNASPRTAYPHHDDGDASVGCVMCFVVATPYRGHGVATKLLEAACARFAREGMAAVEAYPRRETPWSGAAYHGPLKMYEAAGFQVVAEDGNVLTVRRKL